MFRKPYRNSSNSLLKSSDRRKFRSRLLREFPKLTEAALDAIFSVKDEIVVIKTAPPSSAIIYTVADEPLFFEIDQVMFPTVYALWKAPNMLFTLPIRAPVLQFLAGGADLMLPGVAAPQGSVSNLGTFSTNEICAICIEGNPSAVAVGELLVDSNYVLAKGLRGRGVRIAHVYHDQLWRSGSKSSPSAVEGSAAIEVDDVAAQAAIDASDMQQQQQQQQQSADSNSNDTATATSGRADGGGDTAAQATTATEAGSAADTASAADDAPQGDTGVSTASMDSLLVAACARGLHSVDQKQLPLLVSTFMSAHVLKERIVDGVELDVKRSSFKKVSKLMSALAKLNLITMKENKGVANIMGINRKHELYAANAPSESASAETPVLSGTVSARTGRVPQAAAAAQQLTGSEPCVTEIYRAQNPAAACVLDIGDDITRNLNREQCVAALWKYAAAHELAKGRDITLDQTLAACMKGCAEGDKMSAKDILPKFVDSLLMFHMLRGDAKLRKGRPRSVKVETVDRSGGRKHVTHLIGLEHVGLDPEAVQVWAQTKFAASTTVQPLPAKGAGLEVLIQGNVLQDAAEWLVKGMGVPKQYVELSDKRKKK